jgi:hypothetical protein
LLLVNLEFLAIAIIREVNQHMEYIDFVGVSKIQMQTSCFAFWEVLAKIARSKKSISILDFFE